MEFNIHFPSQHSLYHNTVVPVIGIWISIRYEWTFLLPVILPHIEHNLYISFQSDPLWHQLTIVSAFVLCILQPGDHFTNNIWLKIQILWKMCFAWIPLLGIGSLQFSHMPREHSCTKFHIDHSIIIWIKAKWNFHKIWNHNGKNICWLGTCSQFLFITFMVNFKLDGLFWSDNFFKFI